MAKKNLPSDEDLVLELDDDTEIFVEQPTVPSAVVIPEEAVPVDFEGVIPQTEIVSSDPQSGQEVQTDEVPMIAAPLPEMSAEMWQAGIQAVVTVPDTVPSPAWPRAEEWAAEARLFRREADLAEIPEEAAALKLAASRSAAAAGAREDATTLCDEALELTPDAPDALRARARIAEAQGDFDGAHGLWARLAVAAETEEEGAFYGALTAEWSLARDGALTVAAREAIPAGPARALAAVEEALLGRSMGDAAPALADAGRAVGGSFGAALVEEAARFFEMQGQLRQAEAQRAAASEIDREARAGLLGHLRDAARLPDRDAARVLADLTSRLPASSPLAHAVARWAARVARRRGDNELAGTLLDALPATTTVAARDRLDFEVATGAPLDGPSLDRLRADVGETAGSVMVIWIEVGNLLRRGETAAAAALLAGGIEAHPDAAPLGLLAEELASVASDPATKAAALDLWLRADPARRAEAALARAQVTFNSEGEGWGPPPTPSEPPATGSGRQSRPSPTRSEGTDDLASRAALQTAIESAPGSALFWMAAEADARAGRHADAAATLDYGAAMWAGSQIEPALRACAAAHLACVDPVRAANALASPDVARAFGVDAGARLAERAGNRDLLVERLADAGAACSDPERRTSLDARRAALLDDDAQRALALGQALELMPDHPIALPLWALAAEVEPDAAAAALWRAGAPDSTAPALARLLRLAATISACVDRSIDVGHEALQRAREIVAQLPEDRPSRLALVRAARGQPDVLAAMPDAPAAAASDPIELVVAEARAPRDPQRASELLGKLLGQGRFAAEARRVLARLAGSGVPGVPPRLLFGTADDEAAVVRDQMTTLLDAGRAARWETVLVGLEKFPPQEATASPATLFAATLIAEGRSADPVGDPEAARLAEAALAGAGDDANALPLLGLARVADGKADLAVRARAFELAAKQVAASGDRESAVATIEAGLARLHAGAGATEPANKSWRAALAIDPTCLPAALALRREAARRGDLRAAIDATEIEAACLVVPSARVATLLLAAALATEAFDRNRALGFLRAALESDPAHEAAFEQLRSLLSEANDAAGLAQALAARIAVAPNPFEVTSLRLARAEALATKLGDRAGACQELEAILEKQPEHARAMARLSELLWEGEKWSEAGEIYLKRAMIEREPRTLREVFLRIGHIYAQRVPDHARAIMAYERVRAVESDNRDALRALSELYAGEGDPKLALPVTERLVAIETEPRRRTAFRVRLGELLMRTGDLRRAGTELRRAVDATPRDVAAVTALAQLLERVRDQAGRRAMIDHSVGLLRHDVERGELSVDTLRGLAALLPLRDRLRAGAAAAQLVAALEAGRVDRAAVTRSNHQLAALRRPEIDERVFPPGIAPGIRQIMRLVGPSLRPAGPELVQQLSRHGVVRSDRVGRTEPPRPLFDSMATLLSAGEFDLYIKAPAAKAGPVPVRVEPGTPAAIIIGAPVVDFGPAALRFVAARTLRLIATNLDLLLAVPAEEAAAIVVGIIRQFVPDYRHAGVRDALAEAEASRAARLIPRKLRPSVLPFAVESAGQFDPLALHAAVRDGANAVGLLAAGDLPAALSVVLATSGMSATSPTQDWDGALSLSPIVAHPEGLALLRFAVSDDYDDLVLAMESG